MKTNEHVDSSLHDVAIMYWLLLVADFHRTVGWLCRAAMTRPWRFGIDRARSACTRSLNTAGMCQCCCFLVVLKLTIFTYFIYFYFYFYFIMEIVQECTKN